MSENKPDKVSENKPSKRPFRKFPLEEYLANPQAVKKINDATLDYAETLYEMNEQLRAEEKVLERQILLLDTENAVLKERVRQAGVISAYQIFLVFFGGVLISIGIGLVYSSQNQPNPLGWILLGTGILLSISAGIIYRLSTKQPRGGSE
jgi:F0F1-type ATP synthase assembly protein I